MRKKKKFLTLLIAFILVVASCMNTASLAGASEADRVPDLTGEAGTLQVGVSFQVDEENSIPVPGAEFRVTKVADLTVNGGSADYTWLSPYDETGVEIAGMTKGASMQLAKTLENMISDRELNPESFSGVTGANGLSEVIADLTPGMYLIYDFDHPQINNDSLCVDPYLIQVPNPDPTNGNNWIYQVQSYPKSMSIAAPVAPVGPPIGEITVTKLLTYAEGGEEYKLITEDARFYVGLFLDELGIYPYEGADIKEVHIQSSSHNSVTFEDLPEGTYYVLETNQNGDPILPDMPMLDKDGHAYVCELEEGSTNEILIQPVEEGKDGKLVLKNRFIDFPDNYYIAASIDITKYVVKGSERTIAEGETFYAGIFKQEDDNVKV
ncbi:MAG: hypothetical protein KBT01_06590, partial [Clostridiales bacterium]|nr:hypothetical protein [Candidatus Blautia equi]